MTNEEIFEKRTEAVEGVLREAARRQGLQLRKSREDGTYGLIDENHILVDGDQDTGYGLSIEAVATKLGLKVITSEDGPSLTTWAHR